jgi:hypothetical protein
MVKVRMRHEYVVDPRQLLERQVAHAGTGIDEDVIVDLERSGAEAPSDPAAAPEYPYAHRFSASRGLL